MSDLYSEGILGTYFMVKELLNAKKLLESSAGTLAVVNGERNFVSHDRGIKPLLGLLRNDPELLKGAYIADKVTGRASAWLLLAGGVSMLYTEVLSRPAAEVLEENGIPFEFGSMTDGIVNRSGDGSCPMESATALCTSPGQAIAAIEKKLAELSGNLK